MNLFDLKQKLINEPELIVNVLENIGCAKIKLYSKEYRCAKDEDSNATGISVKVDTLSMTFRSSQKEVRGDIFTLVQTMKGCNFPQSIKIVCEIIGVNHGDYCSDNIDDSIPFGGYFLKIKNQSHNARVELDEYPESTMDEFEDYNSVLFHNDGIDYDVQEYFGVRYDIHTDRIVVPWRNPEGKIIGIMGRYNASADYCKENFIAKWYPIINFQKSQVLFGFSENYNSIQEQKQVIVTESEKGVMQLRSMKQERVDEDGVIEKIGIEVGLGVGSHSISEVQMQLIHSLFPEQIILAFDEDVTEEYLIEEAQKLKAYNPFSNCSVGYIYDRENKYLPKGSKMSPSDLRRNEFKLLVAECIHWI